MPYYVYILASGKKGTLYVGMTNDIARRLWEHRHPELSPKSFTARYAVNRLVYVETSEQPGDALAMEKRLKNWQRAWKIRLIEERNPEWRDLSDLIEPT